MGPLVQSATNSRYFVIQGTTQAVMLAGSHTWNNFLDIGTNGPMLVFTVFETVTITPELVAEFPAASFATAVKV